MSASPATTDLSVHLTTVLTGLHWLYDTIQPDDAVVRGDTGQTLISAHGWRFTFTPAGPTGTPTLVVDTRSSRRGLSRSDVDELAEHIEDFGETVRSASLSGQQGTLLLDRPAHPSLLAATAQARRGRRGVAEMSGCPTAIGIADLQRQTPSASSALAARLQWPASGAGHRGPRTAIPTTSTAPASLRLRNRLCRSTHVTD